MLLFEQATSLCLSKTKLKQTKNKREKTQTISKETKQSLEKS